MTDCGPFLQAGADDYARAQVSAATEPLAAQIATLTTQLNAARATLVTSVATVADRDRTITELQQQIAALKAQQPPPAPAPTGPPLPMGWSKVTFFDDFTGPLDPTIWKVADQVGYKRDVAWLRKEQVTVKDSLLVISAANLPTPINGRTVTSGEVTTRAVPGVRQRGGRYEVCAALPMFDAAWSAGWLRDAPAVGELDMFETVGSNQPIVQTAHENTDGVLADGVTKTDHLGYAWVPPAGWDRTAFHVYALEWDADTGNVRWYIDGKLTRSVTPSTVAYPSGKPAAWLTGAAYSQPMALLLNLQIGGGFSTYWGGQKVNPAQLDGSTRTQLRFDWVRFLTR